MLLEMEAVAVKMVLLHLKVHREELQVHHLQQTVYLTIQVEINQLEEVAVAVLLEEVLVVIQAQTTEVVEVLVEVLLQELLSQMEVEEHQEIIQVTMILITAKEEVEVILHHSLMVMMDLL